jgi:hypothetical protein
MRYMGWQRIYRWSLRRNIISGRGQLICADASRFVRWRCFDMVTSSLLWSTILMC